MYVMMLFITYHLDRQFFDQAAQMMVALVGDITHHLSQSIK